MFDPILNHLKHFWFLHSTWVVAVLHFMVPSVNQWIDGHPHTMLAIIGPVVIARIVQGPTAPLPTVKP